jgi:hypothetical protein
MNFLRELWAETLRLNAVSKCYRKGHAYLVDEIVESRPTSTWRRWRVSRHFVCTRCGKQRIVTGKRDM